jgi:DNA-binding MarR family transcriptional regulator
MQTMSQLAAALDVSARRITVLVEALDAGGLVERHRHPTDGRSTLVAITDAGIKHQARSWEQHRAEVGQAFGDLPAHQQKQLLAISRALTGAMRTRLAGRAAPHEPG